MIKTIFSYIEISNISPIVSQSINQSIICIKDVFARNFQGAKKYIKMS